VTYVVPARYFLVILRGIVLKGQPLSSYPVDVALLSVFGTAVLGLAWLRLIRERT
jgi:ABC-2 type transport system permease protein